MHRSAPKIMTFFPWVSSVNKNFEQESNPMLEPVYLYLSRSSFLISFTDPNEQLPNAKSVLLNCGSTVQEIYRLITFLGIEMFFFC